MKLCLNAKSKNNVGYIPDWLQVTFKENKILYNLTLDIQCWTDYDNTCLSCRCKGELVPWVLFNCETGDEINLYSLSKNDVEIKFPVQKIVQIICNSEEFRVGIYPASEDDFERAENDVLSECNGSIEIYIDENHSCLKEFNFETELNI